MNDGFDVPESGPMSNAPNSCGLGIVLKQLPDLSSWNISRNELAIASKQEPHLSSRSGVFAPSPRFLAWNALTGSLRRRGIDRAARRAL
jgi:hypothetical protein